MPHRQASTATRRMLRSFFLLLAAGILSQTASWAQPVITIGVKDIPPLSQRDGSGMLDRVLIEAFRRIGRQVAFAHLPHERSLTEAEAGTIDGDSVRIAGLEAQYPNLVRVPESMTTYEFTAFAKEGHAGVSNWESLRDQDVGYLIGWKIFEENVRGATVNKVATARQLFTLLDRGRIAVALYERRGGEFAIKDMGLTGIRTLAPPLATREMYLYLNRKHAALLPLLAKALKDMKADGTYAALIATR